MRHTKISEANSDQNRGNCKEYVTKSLNKRTFDINTPGVQRQALAMINSNRDKQLLMYVFSLQTSFKKQTLMKYA